MADAEAVREEGPWAACCRLSFKIQVWNLKMASHHPSPSPQTPNKAPSPALPHAPAPH